jgi:two-component system response regulator FixJ
MMPEPTVYVIDDDQLVRESLEWLLQSVKLPVQVFDHAQPFLAAYRPGTPGCVIMDVRMPGIGGMDLHRMLRERDPDIPVIIVTGHADVPMAIRAMKEGAFDFIEKPYNDQHMLERVQAAIAHHQDLWREREEAEGLRQRFDELTPREAQVMLAVLRGHANKRIAVDLGISIKTVELHRTHLMNKLGVRTATELVRLAIKAGIEAP